MIWHALNNKLSTFGVNFVRFNLKSPRLMMSSVFLFFVRRLVTALSLRLKGKLTILKNLSSNVLKWVKEFRVAIERTSWDDNTSFRVLKSIISTEILDQL